LQPIVGFNYGAENYRRVREAVSKAAIIATGVSIAGFAGLMLFPGAVFGLFTKDADLVREGSQIIRILAIMMPLIGFQIIGSSLFQALGKPIPAMALAMSRQILFLIPLVLVLPLFFSLAGIWAAFPCADMLSAFVTALWVGTEMRNLRLKACGSS
jgi:Na+-driven multidrug efflux pump